MTLWKRGRQYWMDTVVGRQRYREPLHTTAWREAKELDVSRAIEAYAKERRAQVSPRMVAYWTENAKPRPGAEQGRPSTSSDLSAHSGLRFSSSRTGVQNGTDAAIGRD